MTIAEGIGTGAVEGDRVGRPRDAAATLPRGRDLGRVVRFDDACRRYGRWDAARLADAYSTGDEVAYDLGCDFHDRDDIGWRSFHQLLENGTGPAEGQPPSVRAFLESVHDVPGWVDWDQLERGAIAYWQPGSLVPFTLTAAIGRGFKSYGGMKPLVISGRLLDPDKVGRRMVETLRYIAAVTTPDSMRPGGTGWSYSVRLRMIHASVRWACSRRPQWDWAAWGLPVNNTDNLTACLEFSIRLIDMLDRVGVRYSRRQRDDIVALWRYIAYVLGTPESLLPADPTEARRQLAVIDRLGHAPDDSNRELLHSLVAFASTEGIGYDPLPDFVSRRLTPARRSGLTYGVMRFWTGRDDSEEMAIPDSPFRHLMPALSPALAGLTLARRLTPAGDAARCARALEGMRVVTDVPADAAPLVDPQHVASDITRSRRPG